MPLDFSTDHRFYTPSSAWFGVPSRGAVRFGVPWHWYGADRLGWVS